MNKTMQKNRIYHIGMDVKFLMDSIMHDEPFGQAFVKASNMHSRTEVVQHLDAMLRAGIRTFVVGHCSNRDEEGRCKGHSSS